MYHCDCNGDDDDDDRCQRGFETTVAERDCAAMAMITTVYDNDNYERVQRCDVEDVTMRCEVSVDVVTVT